LQKNKSAPKPDKYHKSRGMRSVSLKPPRAKLTTKHEK
jgi:hypothetical protein